MLVSSVVSVAEKHPSKTRVKRMVSGEVGTQGCRRRAEVKRAKQEERRRPNRADEKAPDDEEGDDDDDAGRRGPEEGEEGAERLFDSARRDHHPTFLFFGVLDAELSDDDGVDRLRLLIEAAV